MDLIIKILIERKNDFSIYTSLEFFKYRDLLREYERTRFLFMRNRDIESTRKYFTVTEKMGRDAGRRIAF